MLKVYGTKLCPDCVEAEDILKKNKIIYEFIEITESTAKLKEFLVLRDQLEIFKEIKEQGKIGIPCFVNSEKITLKLSDLIK